MDYDPDDPPGPCPPDCHHVCDTFAGSSEEAHETIRAFQLQTKTSYFCHKKEALFGSTKDIKNGKFN